MQPLKSKPGVSEVLALRQLEAKWTKSINVAKTMKKIGGKFNNTQVLVCAADQGWISPSVNYSTAELCFFFFLIYNLIAI